MTESAAVFGKNNSLVGVITQPDRDGLTEAVAVILLNSGLLHRVGPNRLYVSIARKMASCGCVAVRFDLSGIGDSRSRTDGLPYEEGAILDTQAVMDHLSSTQNIRKFVLSGICAGADNAYRIACKDKRVAGIVLIDSFAFTSYGYYLRSYVKTLRQARSWGRLLTGQSELWSLVRAAITSMKTEDADDDFDEQWQMPPKGEIIENLQKYVGRGGKVSLIYTAGGPSYYNYRKMLQGALGNLFQRDTGNRVDVIDNTDHLFTPLFAQDLIVNLIYTWIESLFVVSEAPMQAIKDCD